MPYVKRTEIRIGRRVKVLRRDNGGEYKSAKVSKFRANRGIVQQFTPSYTPQLNSITKRIKYTLVECTRCMLERAKLSAMYYGEAWYPRCFCKIVVSVARMLQQVAVWILKREYAIVFEFETYAVTHTSVFQVRIAKNLTLALVDVASLNTRSTKSVVFDNIATIRVFVSRNADFMEIAFANSLRNSENLVGIDIDDGDRTENDDHRSYLESGIDNIKMPYDKTSNISASNPCDWQLRAHLRRKNVAVDRIRLELWARCLSSSVRLIDQPSQSSDWVV